MKTIELSAAIASAPVQENLKNFAGLDAQNALGLMTPERLAAVAGESSCLLSAKNVVLQADESIELKVGYGMLLVSTSATGELYCCIVYGANAAQKISGYGNSFKIEKPSEFITRITNISSTPKALNYAYLGRV